MDAEDEKMIWEDFIALVVAGLACGFVDSSLGMGYGVTSASVLVSFGIAPAVASASVHTAEALYARASVGRGEHTPKEVWLTTIFTFLSASGFTLTFAIPILLFPLETALFLAIA